MGGNESVKVEIGQIGGSRVAVTVDGKGEYRHQVPPNLLIRPCCQDDVFDSGTGFSLNKTVLVQRKMEFPVS